MEAQTPQAKPHDKKKDEEKKKGGAAFGDAFGSASQTSTFGAGRAGAGALTALFAGKSGMIAAIAIAATVAGVLGLVGYSTYGPGASDKIGSRVSLFAPKPPPDKNASGSDASGASGNSDSLSMAASANQSADATKEGAAADQAKTEGAGAAGSADAAAAAEAAKKQQAAAAAEAASKAARAKGGIQSKFGSMSAGAGGGGGSHSFGGGTPVAGAHLGGATGFGRSATPAAKGGMRGLGANKALGQALGAQRDNRGAISSQAGGATYDGGKGTGIGGDPGAGTTGAGRGASSPADAATGNPDGNGANRFPAPPPNATASNATPWQNAINTAEMLLAMAALLIFAGSKIKDYSLPLAQVAAGFAAILGLMAAYIGHQIATGPYGQVYQGNMFQAAGTFMAAGAVAMVASNAMTGDAATTLQYVAYGSGALGLGMAIMGAMAPKTSYPPQDFQYQPNGRAPDFSFSGGSTGNCSGSPANTPNCNGQ